MFNIGFSELVLLAIIALIFIGPKQLPDLARTLGKTINELKRATSDLTDALSNPTRYVDQDHPSQKKEDVPVEGQAESSDKNSSGNGQA